MSDTTTAAELANTVPVVTWLDDLLPADPLLRLAVGAGVLVAAAIIAHQFTHIVLKRMISSVIKRTRTTWDDKLLRAGFFRRLAGIAPLIVLQLAAIPTLGDAAWVGFLSRLAAGLTAIVLASVFGAFLTTVSDIWEDSPRSDGKSIAAYMQLVSLLAHLLAIVAAVAIVLERSPWALLTGIGAATAVVLLIFKDTILSFVASIQLATYDMMKVGDWVTLPQFGADGSVIDISLHTVRVQNFDRTISTIPTHKLVDGSIQNWRAMSDGEGRRIKRALRIDVGTIRFLSDADIERLAKIELLADYFADKQRALAQTNAERDDALPTNLRRLTNVGTFRAYLEVWLRARPDIHPDMTFLVRQLEANEYGLPIEIYCFAATTVWAEYEAIQADLFDHAFAVLPEFGLTAFQHPSGNDVRHLDEQTVARAL